MGHMVLMDLKWIQQRESEICGQRATGCGRTKNRWHWLL